MPINIIDNFKLGSNLSLDDRYVAYTYFDVSMYWYPGMQVYQLSDNMAYLYDGSSWTPWVSTGPITIDLINGGTNWSNPTGDSVVGGSY